MDYIMTDICIHEWSDPHDKSSNHMDLYKLLQYCWSCSLCCGLHSHGLLVYYIMEVYAFNSFTYSTYPSSASLLATTHLSSGSICIYFFISHLNKIIWYLSFSVWLISLSITPSRSTHGVIMATFLPFAGSYSIVHVYIYISIHTSIHPGANPPHWDNPCFLSAVKWSHSVMSDSLWPHGL